MAIKHYFLIVKENTDNQIVLTKLISLLNRTSLRQSLSIFLLGTEVSSWFYPDLLVKCTLVQCQIWTPNKLLWFRIIKQIHKLVSASFLGNRLIITYSEYKETSRPLT